MNVSRATISTAFALCAAFALSATKEARALELNDLIIEIDTVYTYESQLNDGDVYRTQDSSRTTIDAVAGNLIWISNSANCRNRGQSLVYKRGIHHGNADCPVVRDGTSTNWSERGSSASYDTTMSVSGTTITLQGKLTGSSFWKSSRCGDFDAARIDMIQKQVLKIKISGNRCEVLEYQNSYSEEEVWTEGSLSGDRRTTTQTYYLPQSPICVVKYRSQQPVREPVEMGGLVRRC